MGSWPTHLRALAWVSSPLPTRDALGVGGAGGGLRSPRPGGGGGGAGGTSQPEPGPALLSHPPEAFHVDMDSGLVTTKRPLQSYERFNLTVVATDGGQPPLWGTTMLLVEVIDVNDNRPVFVRPPNGTVLHIREVPLSPGPPTHHHLPPAVTPGRAKGSPWEGGETEATMPAQGPRPKSDCHYCDLEKVTSLGGFSSAKRD